MARNVSSFQSDRFFAIVSYSNSHGLLLLRSGKDEERPSRIDVLVQDVRAMELRCWTEGLSIEEVSLDYLDGFKSKPVEMLQPGLKVYCVKGQNWRGFILGGIMRSHEDDGSYWDPSALLGDGG